RSELNQAGAGSFNKQLVTYCQSALPQIVRLQADVLRARLIDGQGSLLHGCMAALDAAGSADATVKAAAHKLLDFCSTNFMNTLKTQAEVVAAQKVLEDAQAASQTRKLQEVSGGADGAKPK